MPTKPSIYDRTTRALEAYDWSRPLFVQASPQPHFDEVVDLVSERLGLDPAGTGLLVGPTYRHGDWPRSAALVNPDARLSEATAAWLARAGGPAPSVAVVTVSAEVRDTYDAMRWTGNVACFADALAPVPVVIVEAGGHLETVAGFYNLRVRRVGPHEVFGSVVLSDAEIDGLYRAALGRPDGHVVEVGRFSGGSAAVLALAGRDSGRPGVESIDVERLPAADYLLRRAGLHDEIHFITAAGSSIARRWAHLQASPGVGLLFIDADHSYEGVVDDLTHWRRHLVDGAVVALHDVGVGFGVTRAVYHHLYRDPAFGRFEQHDSLLVCRYDPAAASRSRVETSSTSFAMS